MHKFYSTRGGTRTNCDPSPRMHLEVQILDFPRSTLPFEFPLISMDTHIKQFNIARSESLAQKACSGNSTCALPHVPLRDVPTKNKNKHACCFCSRKLSSHWNSAAIAPIEILLNLCSAFASLKLGSDSPLALSPHLAFILLWWNCPGQSKHPSSLQRWSSVMVEPLSSFRGNIKYPSSHRPPTETASSKKSRSGVHPVHRGNRKRNDDLSNIQSRPS